MSETLRHLEEGERLLSEATPLPWHAEGNIAEADLVLIDYAVNNLPALLRVARAAQEISESSITTSSTSFSNLRLALRSLGKVE